MGKVLSTRAAETKVGEDTIQVSMIRGCPQGEVLSALMWSLMIAKLLERLSVACRQAHAWGLKDNIVIC